MARLLATSALVVLFAVGCGPKNQPSTRHPLATAVVQDGTATFDLDIAYAPKADAQIQLFLAMNAKSLDEMDKVVVDVALEGFVLTEGITEWSGFVPPRQPQKHELTVRALEDVEHAMLTVTVRRSVDSEVLAVRELPFRVTGGTVTPE
jgi:hypothetical protein